MFEIIPLATLPLPVHPRASNLVLVSPVLQYAPECHPRRCQLHRHRPKLLSNILHHSFSLNSAGTSPIPCLPLGNTPDTPTTLFSSQEHSPNRSDDDVHIDVTSYPPQANVQLADEALPILHTPTSGGTHDTGSQSWRSPTALLAMLSAVITSVGVVTAAVHWFTHKS